MRPDLPPERLLLPFSAGPYRMAMGLVACAPDAVFEIDALYPAEMAERRRLLAGRHADVFATTPGAGPACAELLRMLADHLPRRHPSLFRCDGDRLHNALTNETWDLAQTDPLEVAGRLVQEDLCLIDTTGPAPVLAAAVLCFPSRWRLVEKIGRPLLQVHEGVPGYAERLSGAVDRFMATLKPGRAAERQNWSVIDDGTLFQQTAKYRSGVNPAVTEANAPGTLFLRVERQTFLRLPHSGATLFAIRVHSYALARVLAVPGAAKDLAAAVRGLPERMAAYKSLPTIDGALLACLDAAAQGAAGRDGPGHPAVA